MYTAPYDFSTSPTCAFAFGDSAEACFHVEYTPHPALKGLPDFSLHVVSRVNVK